MKKSKFTDQQIVFALRQAETGVPVAEVCRKIGISEATFFNWKRKFSGLGTAELRKGRQLEDENSRLKQVVADLMLDKQMLQDVLKKSFEGEAKAATGQKADRRVPGINQTSLPDLFYFGMVSFLGVVYKPENLYFRDVLNLGVAHTFLIDSSRYLVIE
jgi:putative transposase